MYSINILEVTIVINEITWYNRVSFQKVGVTIDIEVLDLSNRRSVRSKYKEPNGNEHEIELTGRLGNDCRMLVLPTYGIALEFNRYTDLLNTLVARGINLHLAVLYKYYVDNHLEKELAGVLNGFPAFKRKEIPVVFNGATLVSTTETVYRGYIIKPKLDIHDSDIEDSEVPLQGYLITKNDEVLEDIQYSGVTLVVVYRIIDALIDVGKSSEKYFGYYEQALIPYSDEVSDELRTAFDKEVERLKVE